MCAVSKESRFACHVTLSMFASGMRVGHRRHHPKSCAGVPLAALRLRKKRRIFCGARKRDAYATLNKSCAGVLACVDAPETGLSSPASARRVARFFSAL
jgi:hypothetical protein